jgi:AcrR family transcriptional regulator
MARENKCMPRTRLSKTIVVNAAAELANAEGVEALTLHRLAGVLNIRTPSLYNHVDGLPGLYRELALASAHELGARLGNAAIGKSGSQALMSVAQAYRGFIKECPGLYTAGLRFQHYRAQLDPELTRAEEQVVRVVMAVVASFGLSGDDGLHAVRGLRSVVHGFATLEIGAGFGLPLDCDESFNRLIRMLIAGLQSGAPTGLQ